jgi:hypothetical protein
MRSMVDRRRFLRLTGGASVGLVGGLGQGCGSPGDLLRVTEATAGPSARTGADETPIFVPKVNGGISYVYAFGR